MKKINLLITDDHMLVREAWASILNNDPRFSVVASCGSAEEAIERARILKPDVVMMDINLPGIGGIEATKTIRTVSPDSKVLGISLHNLPSFAKKMICNGASGYITKNSSPTEMFKAIHEVYAGRKFICAEIKTILSERFIANEIPNKSKCLSHREMAVIQELKKGLSSKEIAANLFISVKTVQAHRHNVLKKLDLKNTASLVNFINHNDKE